MNINLLHLEYYQQTKKPNHPSQIYFTIYFIFPTNPSFLRETQADTSQLLPFVIRLFLYWVFSNIVVY